MQERIKTIWLYLKSKEVYGVMHIDNATAMVDKAATTHNDSIVIIPQHINLQIIL